MAPRGRDAFVDLALGLDSPPEDGPELPRGCVPYLPCPVVTLARSLQKAQVRAADVVVDVGSGAGRTAALIQLLTGATVIGIEIQRALADAARALMSRLKLPRFVPVDGDALSLPACLAHGSVFFLYCPFGGSRLAALLSGLEHVARARELRVCCVDLPLPPCDWLAPVAPADPALAVYRSTLHERSCP